MTELLSMIEREILRTKNFAFSSEKKDISKPKLAGMIDHTLLSPDARDSQIEKLSLEAIEHGFCSVCVNPVKVPQAFRHVGGTGVMVASVVAFPFGAVPPAMKAQETKWVTEHGADEIDMVINVGALKDSEYAEVYDDIRAVVEASKGKTVKVIIESALLTFEEKVAACAISKAAGARFVKTSTGYAKGGATPEDIALMRFVVGSGMGVKASGGVRTYEDAIAMISAGADRIGASRSIEIVGGAE